ncbi:hypothetical protein B7P43_G01480 [Cryptotermes secundus]|uniref:Uncharacterized protein n=2 Tax=Cryptotermes secundus TaxID=105785 RepID=A0A2J7RK84_9NEOP|nr:hypothetical protein B7P43_G01480 [Cryptotermes secundus]PNF41248.1 hypothetical protein B7P43_G01480 [Cryptotermes secundus]
MVDRKKEEAAMETVLNQLHKHCISLHDDTIKAYVDHFMKVLNHLIVLMKEEDVLFKAMYRRMSGAGSYYDGLKVGKPEEFDVDIVIRLPVSYEEITIVSNRSVPPAFTKVQITTKAMDLLRQRPDWASTYRSMDKWRDKDGFLLQSEFRQWVESVVNKALNRLRRSKPNCYELGIQDPDASGRLSQYHISLKKSGPAMTFTVTMIPSNAKVDVDFVPVIEFTHPKWPAGSVRPLSDQLIKAKRTSWFIVPKPKSKTGDADHTLWRLAFHEQERELINDRGTLKPVCRLLKKLRDSCQLNIASYYLKTLFLWEIDANKAPDFWKMKQSHLFMHMLKILQQNLKRGEIKYYWDKHCNLIEGFQEKHKENLVCRLDNIIAHIERNVSESPIVIAEHIRKFCGFRLYTHCRMEEPLALEASEWLNKNSVLCLCEA